MKQLIKKIIYFYVNDKLVYVKDSSLITYEEEHLKTKQSFTSIEEIVDILAKEIPYLEKKTTLFTKKPYLLSQNFFLKMSVQTYYKDIHKLEIVTEYNKVTKEYSYNDLKEIMHAEHFLEWKKAGMENKV